MLIVMKVMMRDVCVEYLVLSLCVCAQRVSVCSRLGFADEPRARIPTLQQP